VQGAGIRATKELSKLFTPAVPERYREELLKQARGKIPDMAAHLPTDERGAVVREKLMEVKTIHFGMTRYTITRSGPSAGVLPVNRRAGLLQAEYDKALKEADHRWCGVPRDAEAEVVGPMRAVFRGRGRLLGLVFGCVAEVSEDVSKLLKTAATASASNIGMAMGARSYDAAVARHAWHMKRTLGCEVWRSLAGLLLDRVMEVDAGSGGRGPGGARRPDGSGQRRRCAYSQAQQAREAEARQSSAARNRGRTSDVPLNDD